MKINTRMCLSRNPLKFNVHKDCEDSPGLRILIWTPRHRESTQASNVYVCNVTRGIMGWRLRGWIFAYKKGSFFVARAVIHGAIRYISRVLEGVGYFVYRGRAFNVHGRVFNTSVLILFSRYEWEDYRCEIISIIGCKCVIWWYAFTVFHWKF